MDGIYQHYVIDLSSNNNFVQFSNVQGDGNNVRGFELELIANGSRYKIDAANTIISIAGTKPDTKQILNDCKLTPEGFILVEVTYQMSAIIGRGDYQIVLMDRNTNSQLKSFPFYILTCPASFDVSEIVSSNEFLLLTKNITKVDNLIIDTENVIKDANDKIADMTTLENTVTANEAQRQANETQRQLDETDRQNNEAQRKLDETDRQNEEATRKANEAQRQADETQRKIDETDRQNEEAIRQANEARRIINENNRDTAEKQRAADTAQAIVDVNKAKDNAIAATTDTKNATQRATNISTDLENKLQAGYFNGKDGKDGKDGTVVTLQGQFMMQVKEDGHLYVIYPDNTTPPPLKIRSDGHLVLTI